MPPLSAPDAIQPAWVHTRHLLLGRRDFRLLLKLTAVALLAEVGGNFGFNAGSPGRLGHGMPPAMAAVLLSFVLLFAVVGLLIGLLMLYVGSRLQFVLFHSVLRSETWITPIWRRYGPATWRWIGLKLLVALAAVLCLVPVAVPIFVMMARGVRPHMSHASGPLFVGIFCVLAVVLLVVLLIAAAFVLLRDFGLPSMALEATPLRETCRRVVALVRLEPAAVALFVLMRFVLGLAIALCSYFALFAIALVAALPLGGVGYGLWAALRGSDAGHALMFSGWVFLCLLFATVLVLAGIVLFGYGFTFLQAYAIFFLAGRYPLLASQLQAAPAAVAQGQAWPPLFYPPPQPPPAM